MILDWMRILSTIILIISFAQAGFGQVGNDSLRVAKNTVYVEGLGNGLVGSLNYDRILVTRKYYKISARTGFMYIPGTGGFKPFIAIPLDFYLLMSLNKKDHLETGLGVTYWYGAYRGTYNNAKGEKIYYASSTPFGCVSIGYRRQKESGGFFFNIRVLMFKRIAELSFIPESEKILKNRVNLMNAAFPTAGIGLGYTFKSKKAKK